jgi:hypothetical protein
MGSVPEGTAQHVLEAGISIAGIRSVKRNAAPHLLSIIYLKKLPWPVVCPLLPYIQQIH